jgi:hypothetical protein
VAFPTQPTGVSYSRLGEGDATWTILRPATQGTEVPESTATGRAKVTVNALGATTLSGHLLIDTVAPGLFSATTDGTVVIRGRKILSK